MNVPQTIERQINDERIRNFGFQSHRKKRVFVVLYRMSRLRCEREGKRRFCRQPVAVIRAFFGTRSVHVLHFRHSIRTRRRQKRDSKTVFFFPCVATRRNDDDKPTALNVCRSERPRLDHDAPVVFLRERLFATCGFFFLAAAFCPIAVPERILPEKSALPRVFFSARTVGSSRTSGRKPSKTHLYMTAAGPETLFGNDGTTASCVLSSSRTRNGGSEPAATGTGRAGHERRTRAARTD